ncbi:DUF2306 domain-containing protein [Chondrinema litorale]|uniref:DUF2306 domain-containing protein n=1 Tax=Chondrinema litorale TaxID=2994555 RepID=UPI0025437E47|nr:DUF2306 domain-containing protein [Chondrinema litorale]UZR93297.1 DUF2306 domain-containing protein [Chondrinema litorale]
MLLVKRSYFFIAFIIGLLILLKSLDYIEPDFTRGFLIDKQEVFHFYKFPLFAHMFASPVVLLTGIIQFVWPQNKLHKPLGWLYVLLVILFAAPSGFLMSFYAIGGILSTISFGILSLLWIYFTYKAFRFAVKQNIVKHQQYMARSFILTNSAVLLRIFSYINNHFKLSDSLDSYILISWLSWLPWILIYELILYSKTKKTLVNKA